MKKVLLRVISMCLAVVMVILMIPCTVIAAYEGERRYNTGDYTPFIISSINGKSVYSADTSDMCYDFYMKARSYIDDFGGNRLNQVQDGGFSFIYNNITYTPESVYFSKPQSYPSCGLLTGILNYEVNGSIKHIVLVAFRGSDKVEDWITDAAVVTGKDGYHEGFEETAQRHYEEMMSSVRYSLGNGTNIAFSDYISQMSSGNKDYTMIITGHSLGAGVAGVFTSKYLDSRNGITAKNAVAYTFASPLTCSESQAKKERNTVRNVFNIVNTDDLVTKVGADIANGERTGYDFKWKLGKYNSVVQNWKGFYKNLFDIGDFLNQYKKVFKDIGNNHHMGTAYSPTKDYINSHIRDYTDSFVLYDHYDESSRTYQRIVFNNGQLLVSGCGVLDGNWHNNTLIEWARIQDSCTSLAFDEDCSITEIGDYAFSGMTQITGALSIPESVTRIGNYAFYFCSGLTENLILPSKIEYIGVNAFCGCSSIEYVSLTQIQNVDTLRLEYGAFSNCGIYGIEYPPSFDYLFSTQTIWNEYTYRNTYSGANNKKYDYITNVKCSVEDGNFHSYVAPGAFVYLNDFKFSHIEVFLLANTTSVADSNLMLCKENDYAIVHESGFIEIKSDAPASSDNKAYGFTVVGIRDKNVDVNEFNTYVSQNGHIPYEIDTHIYFDVVLEDTINFAGGYGTPERPFLLSTFDHIKKLSDTALTYYDDGLYFQLIDDINCEGDAFGCIPNFNGTFDGNFHTIQNLNMNGWSEYRGFFIQINEGTIVKNLTLDTVTVECAEDKHEKTYFGSLAGRNYGTIDNCCAVNATVHPHTWWAKKNEAAIAEAGGLVGANSGTISNSCVANSTVSSKAEGRNDHHNNSYAISGGLVGKAEDSSNIYNCCVISTSVSSYAYANGGSGLDYDKADAVSKSDKFIGEIRSDSVSNGNNVIYDVTTNASGKSVDRGELRKYEESKGCTVSDDPIEYNRIVIEISASKLPYIRSYFVGDEINIAGMRLIGKMADGQTIPLTGFSVQYPKTGTSGEIPVNVVWNNLSTDFIVSFTKVEPINISIMAPQNAYLTGNSIDKSTLKADGLKAYVLFNNGTRKEITTFTIDTIIPDTVGKVPMFLEKEIEVGDDSFDMTAAFMVNVKCDHLNTSIENHIVPTETEYGYSGDEICSVCHEVINEGEILDKITVDHEHSFGDWTEYDDKQHMRTCVCGETEYADHTEVTVEGKAATCTETGLTDGTKCSACGDVIVAQKTIPTTGHTWDDGVITTEPTTTTEGVKTFTCTVCKTTRTETIPVLVEEMPEDAPQYVINSRTAVIGKNLTLSVSIANNPGIITDKLTVNYDMDAFELVSVTDGQLLNGFVTPSPKLASPYTLFWKDSLASANNVANGTIATLTFRVKDTATIGYHMISVAHAEARNITGSPIALHGTSVAISVIDVQIGDLDGDGSVTDWDGVLMDRYLAGWEVDIEESAADIDGDGMVTDWDGVVFDRYLAGWNIECAIAD